MTCKVTEKVTGNRFCPKIYIYVCVNVRGYLSNTDIYIFFYMCVREISVTYGYRLPYSYLAGKLQVTDLVAYRLPQKLSVTPQVRRFW